jgi:hypothetical protein
MSVAKPNRSILRTVGSVVWFCAICLTGIK